MTKDELIAEIVRLGNLLDAGQLGSVEYVDGVNRAVGIFTGDITPVDWATVPWLTAVVADGDPGKYVGFNGNKVAVILDNSPTIITYKPEDVTIV